MSVVWAARVAQMVGLLGVFVSCGAFLIAYRRYWVLQDVFSQFVVWLNVTVMLVAGAAVVHRVFGASVVVEVALGVLMISLAIILGGQILLLRRARRDDGV